MDEASRLAQADGHECGRTFQVERRSDADGTARLILHGELDLATQGDLRKALLAEQRSGSAVVVVLDQLQYLDSAGIGELLEGSDRARDTGGRFAVTPGTGNIRRVLWIAGVLARLCEEPDRAAEPAQGVR
jgi:anti-anti-sigma factor